MYIHIHTTESFEKGYVPMSPTNDPYNIRIFLSFFFKGTYPPLSFLPKMSKITPKLVWTHPSTHHQVDLSIQTCYIAIRHLNLQKIGGILTNVDRVKLINQRRYAYPRNFSGGMNIAIYSLSLKGFFTFQHRCH